MTPFHNICPATAQAESRSIHVLESDPHLPVGVYLLMEFYCPDHKCDCRRVILRILKVDGEDGWDPNQPPEATLTYGWASRTHCRKWFGGNISEEEIDFHLTLNLELLSAQSPRAEHWLKLVRSIFARDPAYVERLGKHYRLMRSVRPGKPGKIRKFRPL
jgi:hypothetical protein